MSFPSSRNRRLRASPALRRLASESSVRPNQLVWPAFVVPGSAVCDQVPSLPGVMHYSIDELVKAAKQAKAEGINSILLFGVPNATDKDEYGRKAMQPDGLVPTAVKALKDAMPDLLVMTDVCLCAYTTHGHCGVVGEDGQVLNDESLELLSAMALTHARAGADIVAPSDMMDGRVGVIRAALDSDSFSNTIIMSYAAKFASAFYGPFRDAAHCNFKGDRKSYQLDPANQREALREIATDIEEGADIIMIKPALAYLDIINQARKEFNVPLAAYHVSGEYAMVKAAAAAGWLDEAQVMREAITGINRAGADIIVSYYAREFVKAL